MSKLSSPVIRFARRAFIGLVLPLICIFSGLLLKSPSVAASAPASFAAHTDFAAAVNPISSAAGDFNADGKLDLVVTSRNTNTVSILLGTGAGTFGPKTDFTTGNDPFSVAVGDFNGDGKLDLAVANAGHAAGHTVSILLGNGDGTFGAKTDFDTGSSPTWVVVGDFNNDGKLDLAVANNSSATVSILLGIGDGTFGAKTDFGTGTAPYSAAAGDFNGDGKLDLAVTNRVDNTVSILLGTGTGAFGPKTDFATGTNPIAVAVGDFNNDGKLDLATGNNFGSSVSILLGTGTGSFGPKTDLAGGFGQVSVVVGDFNNDGQLDVAEEVSSQNAVSVWLGTGTGTFGPKTDFGTGSTPSTLTVGDFNGDSKPDLATANAGDNTVSILLNTNTARPISPQGFDPHVDYATGQIPFGVAVGDFNGDGKLDLAVANRFDKNSVSILLGTGSGTFGAKTDFASGDGPTSVAVGDFNDDGKLDLAVANGSDSTVSILLGIGDGTFGAKTDFATGNSPASVAVADFNDDGKLDLVVSTSTGSSVSVLLGTGTGTFGPKTDFTTGSDPFFVAVADFNGDGKLDLAVANGNASSVSILLGTGTGTFGAKTDFATGRIPESIAVGDFNGDGKLDLAVANSGNIDGNTVSILLGTGTGTFGAKTDFPTGSVPASVAAGDFNGDGKLDLAVANENSNTVSVLLGTGTGTFGAKTDFATGSNPISVAVGDFNIDGKLDLAVANLSPSTVSILLNGNSAPATNLAITQINAGVNPQAGTPFSVVVQSQDSNGNPDTVLADTSVTLSLTTGTGTLAGTLTGTITAGTDSVTISGVTYSKAESGIVITATRTSGDVLAPGDSAPFTVDAAAVVAPPSIAKAFNPTTIPLHGTTSLTFTITNPNASTALTGVAFTDTLPAGLTVPNATASVCGGTVTLTNPTSITLSGATINANSNCQFSVTVTGAASGQFTNTTGSVTSTNGGTGNTATATVTIASPPTIAKSFGVPTIQLNGTTTLAFNINNPNAGTALTGVAFTDNLPTGLVVAAPNGLSGSCGGGAITAASGSGSISLGGGTLASSAGCTFSVNVTGLTAGVKNNTTGQVTSNEGGTGGTASASITVAAPHSTTTSLAFSANPMVSGQTIQVTATVVDTDAGVKSNPAGTVSFSAGTDILTPASCNLTPLGATTDTSTCQINLSSTTIGTHNVTGNYGGSAIHAASGGNNQLTVNKANTSSVLVSSVNPSVFGQSVTFTVTVSAVAPGTGTPTGAVTFLDGANPLGTVPLNGSGVASFSVSSLSVASHPISITYPGDANFNGSTSNTINQTVNKDATTTALTSNVNPSEFGQNATFTATVTANAPGAGTPTGTVTFFDNGTQIGAGTLNGSGVATFGTATLAVGTHPITAIYAGDGNFNGSTSSVVNQVVNKAPTATALTSSVNPSVFGQSTTFTATVTSIAPPVSNPGPAVRGHTRTVQSRTQAARAVPNGIGIPSGTVTFFDGATQIGTGTLDGSGVAMLTISTLSVGPHSITASYGGNDSFNSSTSPAVVQTVNKANTTTANVASSVNPAVFGQTITLSTTVTATAPGAGIPTGTVTFFDGIVPIGTAPLNGSAQASIAISTLAAGVHSITAVYGGDGNFNGSSSAAITQTVNRAATTTLVTSSANPAFIGGTITFTATIIPTAPGAGIPTGTVQFKDNGANIGGPVTLSAGVASIVESCLTPGLHTITAVFSGDLNFAGSTGVLAGGQNVGFIFTDTVTGNQLIVTVPANGLSGPGTYTWISNGTTIVSNVPAIIEFNSLTLRIRTNSPSLNALFDATVPKGQAILFDTVRNRSFILDTVNFSLVSGACGGS